MLSNNEWDITIQLELSNQETPGQGIMNPERPHPGENPSIPHFRHFSGDALPVSVLI
jgi:hypothetical protein